MSNVAFALTEVNLTIHILKTRIQKILIKFAPTHLFREKYSVMESSKFPTHDRISVYIYRYMTSFPDMIDVTPIGL
jgi:hypothetical protein